MDWPLKTRTLTEAAAAARRWKRVAQQLAEHLDGLPAVNNHKRSGSNDVLVQRPLHLLQQLAEHLDELAPALSSSSGSSSSIHIDIPLIHI
jgi:23S rRNA A2030 N6-methylase RlmJ